MTDIRATERLLEWLAEQAAEIGKDHPAYSIRTDLMVEAITELRRRGDTLVRAEDLRLVVEQARLDDAMIKGEFGLSSDPVTDAGRAWEAAIDRLETAIGDE